jgi:hypothetical protein
MLKTNQEIIDKWNNLKEMSKWCSYKLNAKIAFWQSELQKEAVKRGITLL